MAKGKCANCGGRLAKTARYCPRCGQPRDAGGTQVMEVPENETGPVPVHYTRAEPRYYGITPSTLVLVLAVGAVTVGVVLLASGRWPAGLILVGVSALLLLVFLEVARRKPDGRVARSTAGAITGFRARAGLAADSVATRGRAARSVLGLRQEQRKMAVLRAQLLFELGDAVYRGDEQATETARGRVLELDQLAAEREDEVQAVVAEARERIRRHRLEVQPTEMVELPEEPAAPGEGDPVPARIPEPYPPPDEGSPPQPAIIPEPSPAVIPEPEPPEPDQEKER